ncbi:MAG: hypothetical protein KAG92_08545, partial [Deltaproteobacteria bacterium]|nr:hypothetical protein [Deltaproteobacteria bacterium]
MKRFVFIFFTIILVVGLLHGKGHAYKIISGPDAYEMYQNNEELIVVDVREKISEYCLYGHIPVALNYPWRSGVFAKEYHNLPTDAAILLVCRSGGRSGDAARLLDRN